MIETRNKMVRLLHDHLERPVIPSDTTGKRPAYPYADYSITTVVNDAGKGNYSYVGDDYRVELQKQLSVSITCYSMDETEAYGLAKEAWNFFKHHVNRYDLTVARLEEVVNRTILSVDEFERRFGFDLFLRFDDSISKEMIYMEDITIKQE